MITAVVEYQLPAILPREQVLKIFSMAEGKFRGMDGLDKKYFGYDEKTGAGLSVYIWLSMEQAARCFAEPFATEFEKVFNTRPTIRYIDTLMMIDNAADRVAFF
jgi:hypothetical protein